MQSQIQNADRIKLSHTHLINVPDLTQYKNLLELDLSSNKISSIANISPLNTLIYFNISNNDLESLHGCEKMPNLRKLNAHGNKIQRITGLDKCKLIEYIDLSNNALLTFSLSTKSLKVLSLSNNNLTTIPSLNHCTKLNIINLDNNLISTLTTMYPSLSSNISTFSIKNNSINKIPELVFLKHYNHLLSLSLENNPLFLSFKEHALSYKPLLYCFVPTLKFIDSHPLSHEECEFSRELINKGIFTMLDGDNTKIIGFILANSTRRKSILQVKSPRNPVPANIRSILLELRRLHDVIDRTTTRVSDTYSEYDDSNINFSYKYDLLYKLYSNEILSKSYSVFYPNTQEEKCILKCQSWFRGVYSRKIVNLYKLYERSVVTIQKVYRGHLARIKHDIRTPTPTLNIYTHKEISYLRRRIAYLEKLCNFQGSIIDKLLAK